MKPSRISKSAIASLALGALFAVLPQIAFAQGGGAVTGLVTESGCAADGTIGTIICDVVDSTALVPGLLSGLSYLFGVILGAMGIAKMYEHVQNPHQTPVWEFIKKFLAGGSFFALPTIMEAARSTMVGSDGDVDSVQIGAFNVKGISGGGLDAMVVTLVANIWEPLEYMLMGFGYIAGIILIMVGITRLLKTAQEGPRGPGGIGTIMTFITGGAMFSLGRMMGAWTSSLFATTGPAVSNYAAMSLPEALAPKRSTMSTA
jgi:hypothetical protein